MNQLIYYNLLDIELYIGSGYHYHNKNNLRRTTDIY